MGSPVAAVGLLHVRPHDLPLVQVIRHIPDPLPHVDERVLAQHEPPRPLLLARRTCERRRASLVADDVDDGVHATCGIAFLRRFSRPQRSVHDVVRPFISRERLRDRGNHPGVERARDDEEDAYVQRREFDR